MAKFDIEFQKIVFVEGGYVNDPDDAGGETYLGISRKANPNWGGWRIIDKIKKEGKFTNKSLTDRLKKDKSLTTSAKLLYKEKYWDVMELDDIPSQDIAHQLFDTGVNMGVASAIRIAQQIIGMTVTGKFNDELKYNLMQYGNNK